MPSSCRRLINGLGDGQGQLAWEDAMLFDDPEAPTTIDTRFEYGPLTGGEVTGSVVIDAGLRRLARPSRVQPLQRRPRAMSTA